MSVDGLRDAIIREKKNEIATCELAHKRKLRELWHVNAYLNAGSPPQHLAWLSDDLSEDERRFLDANDITKGRRFDDSTLPYPIHHVSLPSTLPFQAPAKPIVPALSKPALSPSPAVSAPLSLEEQLRAASASPAVTTQPEPPLKSSVPVHVPPAPKTPLRESPQAFVTPQAGLEPTPDDLEEQATGAEPAVEPKPSADAQASEKDEVQEAEVATMASPDGPSADPLVVVPPSVEDDAALDAILPDAPPLVNPDQDGPKAPMVVHLPPQEEQEARLVETELKLKQAREQTQKEDEKEAREMLGIPTAHGQGDAVSSPASTVGPYSQATPHAPHQSPDTSPDRESFGEQAAAPVADEAEADEDAAARQAKEEHEHALEQQMQAVREVARGDTPDGPEVERQIEEEQAIRLARDGKSDLTVAEPTALSQTLTERAESVVGEVTAADAAEAKSSADPAVDSLLTPTTTAPEPSRDAQVSVDPDAKPQEPSSAGTEHPTPPAEVDVEMTEASAKVREQDTARPQSPSPGQLTRRLSSESLPQQSASAADGKTLTPKPMLTPRSSNASAVSASPARSRIRESKQKVSTVTFVKHDPHRYAKELQLINEDYASLQGAAEDPNRDYLIGLFQYQAHHPPRSQPLVELVNSARKTLSTSGVLAMTRETCDYKILKRVYQLQNANRWPHRQLQKSAEPQRPISHLDHLLKEMKWMRTDFKEERKWKKALSETFANWCAEYVNGSPDERASLRIKARLPPLTQRSDAPDEDMNDAPTPDLVHAGANETESDSFDEEDHFLPHTSISPAALFSLGYNDVVMKIDSTSASDAMFAELPLYEPILEGSADVTPRTFYEPHILPVSKFTNTKLVSTAKGSPRKHSRFNYEPEDEQSRPQSRAGTSAEQSAPSTPGRRLSRRDDLPPEDTNVALFAPEYRHIRERLHAGHQFKPPTEFPMPTVSFFEARNSSQWLWDEDQRLRSLVKEYSFNWSLVAQELALPSMYYPGAGRRTPWECFERWMILDGLPTEMNKTPYFKTYTNRLDQANRAVTAQHQQTLALQTGQNQSQARRRTTVPVRVERRRDQRHLAMIDAMRKMARKREQNMHKQAEAQKAAALRKAHEPTPANKSTVHTPQEFSRLRWEKEEKSRQLRAQQQQNAVIAMQQQQQRQMQGLQGQTGMPNNVIPLQRNATPGGVNVSAQMANGTPQTGHPGTNPSMTPRQHTAQQAMQANFPNGNLSGMSMNTPGVPQAQMQAMPNNQRMAPPDQQMRIAMQRAQYPATNQQHAFQLQQQQINMASNLTANMGMNNGMPNANMLGSMAGQNMSANMNTQLNGAAATAGSPRLNQVNPQMQNSARTLSSGHVPQLLQLQNTLKVQHPDWPPEQIQKAASHRLQQLMNSQRVQAMAAAAGPGMTPSGMTPSAMTPSGGMTSAGMTPSQMTPSPQIGNNSYLPNGGMQNTPSPNAAQAYHNQIQQRMMQQRQQAASPAMSARPMSRSATPQNPQQMGMQSPGSSVPGSVPPQQQQSQQSQQPQQPRT
jgi:chromatin modification-related protein VID21